MSAQLTQVLTELVRQQAALNLPAPSHTSALAQDLLRFNSAGAKPFIAPKNMGEAKEQPSVVSRIFDLLARPLYGVANYVKNLAEDEHDPSALFDVGAFWKGFSGQEKTLFSDVLEETGMEQGAGRSILGFGLDVAADPLSWIGVGLAPKILGKTAKATTEALGDVGQTAETITRQQMKRITDLEIPRERYKPMPGGPGELVAIEDIAEPVAKIRTGGDLTSIRKRLEELLDEEMVAGNKNSVNMISVTLRDMKKTRIDAEEPLTTAIQRAQKRVDELAADEIAAGASPPLVNLLKAQMKKGKAGAVEKETNMAAEGVVSADRILEDAVQKGEEILPPKFPEFTLSANNAGVAADIAEKAAKGKEIKLTQQINILNRIQDHKNLANVGPATVTQILREVEDRLIAKGIDLVDNSGNSFRLTDAIMQGGGPTQLNKVLGQLGPANQLMQVVMAQTATKTAQEAIDPALAVVTQAAKGVDNLPVARAKEVKKSLEGALGDILKEAKVVSKDIEASKQFLNQLFNVTSDAAFEAVERQARDYLRWVATGKSNPAVIEAVNKGVYKVLGSNPKWLSTKVGENRAVEAIMVRLATWYNAKDLRPFAREHIDTMLINAAAFEKKWLPVFKSTTERQRIDAFKVAQGIIPPSSLDEARLSNLFKHQMEQLFSSSGVRDQVLPGSSVVTRSGITMDEVNEALEWSKSSIRFTNKKGTTLGRDFDYSNGADWMKSWEIWGDTTDPIKNMYEVHHALQRIARKNSMIDDAIARWGVTRRGGDFIGTINHPRTEGFYFPEVISDQMNVVLKRFSGDEFKSANSPVLRLYDNVLRAWKAGVTIYSPSHHIRNIIGDMFLGTMDGVISLRPYFKAMRVMAANRGKYTDIMGIDDITDPALLKRMMTRPGETIVTMKNGQKLTAAQLYVAAHNKGILTRIKQIEELQGDPLIPQVFGGRVQAGAHAVSETRDHLVRLAHFIDVLSKTKAKTLEQGLAEAARRVKKWHPDGMDLTGFERNVMRRLLPFYSWLRKSTPLVIEGLVMRPHLVMAYPKGMAALQDAAGIDMTSGFGDPFPADQMFPAWIREKGIGPIAGPPGAGGIQDIISGITRQASYKGEEPGYSLVNPSNPMIDQLALLNDWKKSAISAATPMFSIPAAFLSERTTLGIPIRNDPAFLAQTLPPVELIGRLTGAKRTLEGRAEPASLEAIMNWLTAGGFRGTGPYRRQALYEQQQALRDAAIEANR